MKAIVTKYAGPSNKRGSRIVASAEGVKSVSIPYGYEEREEYDLHAKAARALMAKYGWSGPIVGGGFKNGYVWTFYSKSAERDRNAPRGKTARNSRHRSARRRLRSRRR